MKIAICGGTLSGAALARVLSSHAPGQTVRIDLHRSLHDPARAKPHPLCEYEPLSFSTAAEPDARVREELDRWTAEEWVTVTGTRVGAYDADAGAFRATTPTGGDGAATHRRYRPTGGCFTLIDALIAELPSDVVRVSKRPLIALEATQDPTQRWFLKDDSQRRHGPYDVVLFAYDATPRAARKASFKQLLESALPASSSTIHSLARAVSASAMTVIVAVPKADPGTAPPFDSLVFEGVPALRFATRNRIEEAAAHRGMRVSNGNNVDIWTLVATPEWSQRMRNSHKGKWNKQAVGKEIVTAFARCVGQPSIVDSYKNVNPPFHWQGSSSLTQVDQSVMPPFSFDADASLGFCGDIFGGQGVEGALSSAVSLARHFNLGQERDETAPALCSSLPNQASHWVTRELQAYDDDTGSIAGACTGREEPADGLDHTWPTAVDIANGKVVNRADSLAKYRNRKPRNKTGGGRARNDRSGARPRRN